MTHYNIMRLNYTFISVLILLCVILFIKNLNNSSTNVKVYTTSGKYYYVNDIDSIDLKQDKAIILEKLNKDISTLLIKLKEENLHKKPNVSKLYTNWSGFIEELNEMESETSFAYNINKGEQIAVCLTNKKTGKLNEYNDVLYVILHELAHVMTQKYDHNKEFWDNFNFLVDFTNKHNIYNKIDYSKNPKSFCNSTIT